MKLQAPPDVGVPLLGNAPTTSRLPSPDSETLCPCPILLPVATVVSFAPSCVQAAPFRVNVQTAPAYELSAGPPIAAVLPSADSDVPTPKYIWPATLPVNLACCDQLEPLRVKTHAAPAWALSAKPPTSAVLPSPDSATP